MKRYLQQVQIPLTNYNIKGANIIIDGIAQSLITTNHFTVEELQEAFEELDLSKRITIIYNLMSKYFNFMKTFADIGVK